MIYVVGCIAIAAIVIILVLAATGYSKFSFKFLGLFTIKAEK
jgi:hypothetical protein